MATTRPIDASRRSRRRDGVLAAALCGLAVVPTLACAQARVVPFVSSKLTWTSNARLVSDEFKESDFITSITPGVRIDYRGPRAELIGTVAAETTIYANGTAADRAAPAVGLDGKIHVIPNRFVIEGSAGITDTYYSPFGSRPDRTLAPVENRFTAQRYRITPRLYGDVGGTASYSISNDALWTIQSGEQFAIDNTFTNRFLATIDRRPEPFGWGADFDRTDYQISGRDNQERQLARVRGTWRATPQLVVHASGGYESNRFIASENDGAIYGAGFRWVPNERTALSARWEERFFGASYDVDFGHRTPLTVWSLRASRNITSYPETLAYVPAGTFVPALLNEVFRTRIPDPAERFAYIEQFMDERGLPLVTNADTNLYNEQIYLLELARASAGLVGARNTLLFGVYRRKQEPIEGTGGAPPPQFSFLQDSTEIGFDASWAYRIAPRTTSTVYLDVRRTEANDAPELKSRESIVRWTVTHTLSPRTNVFGGLRYQRYRTDIESLFDHDEHAVFAGFTYFFR
jgi:uncharacterized protein (PEP-CTERM system associated)